MRRHHLRVCNELSRTTQTLTYVALANAYSTCKDSLGQPGAAAPSPQFMMKCDGLADGGKGGAASPASPGEKRLGAMQCISKVVRSVATAQQQEVRVLLLGQAEEPQHMFFVPKFGEAACNARHRQCLDVVLKTQPHHVDGARLTLAGQWGRTGNMRRPRDLDSILRARVVALVRMARMHTLQHFVLFNSIAMNCVSKRNVRVGHMIVVFR